MGWQPWATAWERALYGPDGFFVRGDPPRRHFRTSAHVGDAFAAVVLAVLRDVDAGLGHPDRLDVVDVGSGGGELVTDLLALLDEDLRSRVALTGVDRASRPAELPAAIAWVDDVPDGVLGLVIGNEWLDNVPAAILARDHDGSLREIEVDPATGDDRLGPAAVVGDDIWCSLWWPIADGQRAEAGRTRDLAWAHAVTRIDFGLAVVVDYAHTRTTRRETLTGYRNGRQVPPVPDGSCDITAHVALDSCASAGEDVVGVRPLLASQRDVLRSYAVTGSLPPVELAVRDPGAYARALQRANHEAELIDPNGLGAFTWLVQPVGMTMPARLDALR